VNLSLQQRAKCQKVLDSHMQILAETWEANAANCSKKKCNELMLDAAPASKLFHRPLLAPRCCLDVQQVDSMRIPHL